MSDKTETAYHITPKSGFGNVEVIVFRKKDGDPVAIIPSRDEWYDGDIGDLRDCLEEAIKVIQEMKQVKR